VFSLIILAVALAAGIVASLTMSNRAATTERIRTVDQPSIIVAREVQASLAEADASAATAFLAGGVENADQRLRYEAAVRDAEASMSELAALVADENAPSVVEIQQAVSVYTGLVETARVNNRQGFPVGAAYLSNASALLTNEVYPLTDSVANDQAERYRSDVEDLVGIGIAGPVLAIALIVVLVAALLRTQGYISVKFRRRINVPLVLGTLVSIVLAAWLSIAVWTQTTRTTDARDESHRTIREFVDARSLAFRTKAAESRFLIARGGETTASFDAEAARTTEAIDRALEAENSRSSGAVSANLDEWDAYLATHASIIAALDDGQRNEAEALALGASSTTFDAVDRALVELLERNQSDFRRTSDSAHEASDFLVLGSLLLANAAAILAFVGIQPRINEYP